MNDKPAPKKPDQRREATLERFRRTWASESQRRVPKPRRNFEHDVSCPCPTCCEQGH